MSFEFPAPFSVLHTSISFALDNPIILFYVNLFIILSVLAYYIGSKQKSTPRHRNLSLTVNCNAKKKAFVLYLVS